MGYYYLINRKLRRKREPCSLGIPVLRLLFSEGPLLLRLGTFSLACFISYGLQLVPPGRSHSHNHTPISPWAEWEARQNLGLNHKGTTAKAVGISWALWDWRGGVGNGVRKDRKQTREGKAMSA